MKRILSLILSVVMLLSCFAVSAVAYTTAEDPYPTVEKKQTFVSYIGGDFSGIGKLFNEPEMQLDGSLKFTPVSTATPEWGASMLFDFDGAEAGMKWISFDIKYAKNGSSTIGTSGLYSSKVTYTDGTEETIWLATTPVAYNGSTKPTAGAAYTNAGNGNWATLYMAINPEKALKTFTFYPMSDSWGTCWEYDFYIKNIKVTNSVITSNKFDAPQLQEDGSLKLALPSTSTATSASWDCSIKFDQISCEAGMKWVSFDIKYVGSNIPDSAIYNSKAYYEGGESETIFLTTTPVGYVGSANPGSNLARTNTSNGNWVTFYMAINPEKVLTGVEILPLCDNTPASYVIYVKNVMVSTYGCRDITITPTNTNGANITDYDAEKTALSTTVFEDKVAWKLGKVGNNDTTEGAFKINQLSVNVSNYNYILVNCYYTGATGLKPGSVCITGAQNITSWFTLYPHKVTTNLSTDTRLTNGDINTGTWMTLVIPIYNVDITSATRTMADNGVINELSLRLHGIGGVGADMYVSSVTFSQSSTPIVDKTVNDEVIFRGAQMSNDGTKVRFLATIDNLDTTQYSKIGFKVTTADGTQSWDVSSATVYTSVSALDDTITAAALGGQYIVAFVVDSIPASTSADFIITPYLVSADGETTTNGATATAKMVNNAIAAGAVTFN